MSQYPDTKTFNVMSSSQPTFTPPSTLPLPTISSPPPPSSSSSPSSPYSFLVEWFDSAASLARKFTLTYFPSDATLELFDLRLHRTFLKRCAYPTVPLSSLYIGGQVTIYARTLRVIGYGDESTRARLDSDHSTALALIKPSATPYAGAFLQAVHSAGMRVGRLRMLRLTPAQAQQFYGDAHLSPRAADLASGRSLAVEVVGKGAHTQIPALLASLHPGSTIPPASVHTSTGDRSAADELAFLFALPPPATYQRCALLLLKPHLLVSGRAGEALQAVQAQFAVTAMQSFHLTREAAEEFFEVYKGVVGEWAGWVEELSSGQCIAVEVTAREGEEEKEGGGLGAGAGAGVGVADRLRALAGPYDPDIARHLRKASLRALYGVNRVKNAVHVTDLAEDGPLESEFFFNLLQDAQ